MLHFGGAWGKSSVNIGLPIKKILNVNISVTAWARGLNFFVQEVLSRNFIVLQARNDRSKRSPQLGFKNPKNETSEGHNSKKVEARTLKFGVQIATGGAI